MVSSWFPQYNDPTYGYKHDIAVVKLSEPLDEWPDGLNDGRGVSPIPLISDEESRNLKEIGTTVRVASHGYSVENGDRNKAAWYTDLPIVDPRKCSLIVERSYEERSEKIHYEGKSAVVVDPFAFCAGENYGDNKLKSPACFGDSGGSATIEIDGRPVLAGVMSRIIWSGQACNPKCTLGYNMFIKVSGHLAWMSSVIGNK